MSNAMQTFAKLACYSMASIAWLLGSAAAMEGSLTEAMATQARDAARREAARNVIHSTKALSGTWSDHDGTWKLTPTGACVISPGMLRSANRICSWP